jgi:ribosomal protein S18 acetylase RimI-like enzyme
VLIRRATPGDETAVATVHVRSWQVAYRGLMPDEVLDGLSVERRADMWRAILEPGPGAARHIFLVAEAGGGERPDGNALCGFVHVGPARDADLGPETAELTSIYLLPEAWGRGAGRALMARAVDAMREAGYASAVLWVLVTNERARRFYDIAGWSADGTEKSEPFGPATLVEARYRRPL